MAVAIHTAAYLIVMTLAAWIVYPQAGPRPPSHRLVQHGPVVGCRALVLTGIVVLLA